MAKFNKGDKIKNVNTNEIGYIIDVYLPRRGKQLYRVKYDDHENDENSKVLVPDVDLTDPFERCKQNYYSHYTEYLKGNTTFKIRSSNNSTISSLKASRTLFRPYQFKPLLKFLDSDDRRILIADEVGLGKTIEAGHIMLELKARGEFHNALVVCPMSLRQKWATELKDKFGLDFAVINKKEELIMELQHHNGSVHAVINYDKIRENSDIVNYILEKSVRFSLIVCDESHKLRNNNTLIYRGADKVLQLADSAVFMSATPIMINEGNLYNQLHLLDADVYDNEEVFRNNIILNRPFLQALSQLNSGGNLKSIAKTLANTTVTTYNIINDVETMQDFKVCDYFKDYPIYQEIISDLQNGKDNPAQRAKIQYNLSEMSPMNSIFSRTRKREVTRDWSQAERNPQTEEISLTVDEKEAYSETIHQYISDHVTYDEYGREYKGSMGLVTLKRQLASSVWGCLNSNAMLDKRQDAYAQYKDAKFDYLLKTIKTVFAHREKKKIIVFAIFKKTIKYLSIRLEKAGYKNVMIYGDSNINKFEVLNQFQYDDSIQVLLSSEVGSEGLDMQFCNSLVNYDLPWNPMVVEQRIGRIDRFGQDSPKVNIYTLIVKDSILEKIYVRLLKRIGIFRESIGDLEAILDSEMEQDGRIVTIKEALKSVEKDFYSDKLTEEEVTRKQIEIDRAIETEKINLQKIEDGLTNTLTNDSYFRNEINKIVKNNAYVTGKELYELIVQLIKEKLTTCELKETTDRDVLKLELPKSNTRLLANFLLQYEPTDYDNREIFGSYIREIDGQNELLLTFDQEKAFHNKRLSFVNIYHPIVVAAVRFFEEEIDKRETTYFFEMKSDNLPEDLKSGNYMLAIYKISVSRILFGKQVKTESLYPILFDLTKRQLIDDHELAEKFMGCAQTDGQYAPLEEEDRLDNNVLDDLRYDLKDTIDAYVTSYRTDLNNRIENAKKLRYQQTIQYYETRIKSLRSFISTEEAKREIASITNDTDTMRNADNAIRLQTANIRGLEQREASDLERINKDVELKVTEEIKSLNLVKVI